MEEVQKNENGTTVPQTDGKPEKEKKPKRELTPRQIQQRRKMIVFPLMFLAFAGCMYLIFAPSGKEDVNVESVGGFNADIPLPAEDGIIADKQKAYEQAMLNRKQQDKIQSLQDFGFMGDDETEEPQAEIDLMPEEDVQPQRGGGASYSANAYRDINRQLSTFYETPAVDEEKEDLKRQVEELTDRLQQQQNATPTADDQMALLEKSYELAAKYMNGGQGQVAQVPVTGGIDRKPDAVAVQAVRETTVSGLQQPMSDADFIRAYSQPRNYGFNTAVGTGYAMGRNTIAACIHQDQTLTDGQAVKLRLLEPMQAGNIVVPKNTLVAGTAKVQGERLDILVSSIEYAGNIIPVELAVFDTDGQKGLSVPSSMEQEAFNEAMANIGSGLGTSISFARSAGQQVAMDVTRGLLQGTSGYLAKKFRTVKVKLKAGYKVMLYAKQQ
ncbi:conjugative transposon protein TraM [Bacteroides muris (ex Fokt et al. 2023)]|uniref:Conjugative transposon protein TraM n=1 Tax=Bacteroides muris (ex Fokt et al. 2023) TaxID=2937417 RepID=A0A9X2SUV1_9BACE|nr:conjugative transposon protein TraM [Bacteroides muris (ex Fokt et al. 2023)]MCR6506102.1 conjugative transposon protein TraM [Bacteroides muris (ex Fokt et al. 2023)]